MIPAKASLEVKKEHEIYSVKRALEARFHVECEVEDPEDPDYITREIGMWFLDVYIYLDQELNDFERVYVVYRAHEGWQVTFGDAPPPGANRSEDEIIHPGSWEDVVEAITTYLTDHPYAEERDADHQP